MLDYFEKSYNVLLLKLAYDFDSKRTKKYFKKQSIDVPVDELFMDCLKVIASGTRFYERRNYDYGFEWANQVVVMFKHPIIEKTHDLERRLQNRIGKYPFLKTYHNKLLSSIHCAVDWLNCIDCNGGVCVHALTGPLGVYNRIRFDGIVIGDAEVLNSLIGYLSWLLKGYKEIVSIDTVRRVAYAKL